MTAVRRSVERAGCRAFLAVALVMCAVLAFEAGPARAERVVADLSSDLVRVTSEFAGERLSLFGVIERDAQTVPRTGKYQVVVVVRGPPTDLLVQRKVRTSGIWVNDAGERFGDVPSYLGIFASESARPIVEDARTEAGPFALTGIAAALSAETIAFRDALIRDRRGAGLYVEEIGAVSMLTDTFFRTLIPLPGVAEDGAYDVSLHLFVQGVPLDTRTLRFFVAKVGFEQRLSQLSRQRPLAYGLAVVALALVTGYVGGVVFKRG